ncbi:MAG: MBOAT family O-acyltransferase [Bacteroidota bacterium]
MRPFRSFLLLLIIVACLTGLFFIFPESRLFPDPEEYLPVALSDLKPGTGKAGGKAFNDTLPEPVQSGNTLHSDTLSNEEPPDQLAPFLDSLKASKGQVRVMYYGDSQIEGDRITFYLRQLLRNGREGTGPGLFLPSMPVMYTKSLWLKSSDNWVRYNSVSYRDGVLSHNRLGPFMTICRYLPESEKSTEPVHAYARIRPSVFADSSVAGFEKLRLFYSNAEDKVKLTIKANDYQVYTGYLERGADVKEITTDLYESDDILLEFEGTASPDILGISIESKTGIIVDNIPRRGSAGLEFTLVDRENLRQTLNLLSPDLIVLHYGLNIVRNVRKEYNYYRQGLTRQLNLLKEIAPGTPVMVVGVTDMAAVDGDSIVSYSNIPAIINAQKNAASDAGALFWSPYDAMGGASSIVAWAGKRPPLAQTDYVHFTYPGADTLSQMLADAIFRSVEADTLTLEHEADTLMADEVIQGVLLTEEPGEKNPASALFRQIFRYDEDRPFIFTAPAFWIFFLLVLAGYSLIYKKLFLRHFYLLLVSLFFYYKSGGLFLFLLVLVTIIDYTCGILIFRSGKKLSKKFFILISILSNLGILAYFKYTGFVVDSVNQVFGTDFQVYDFLASFSNSFLGTSFDISNIILPVGISFFTFQSLSYTIDVFRGRLEPVRNIADFGFYVSFFPQLVAGPIVRASEFIPQLYRDFSLSKREFSHALFLVLKGLIKKMIISDFIATNFIDRVFDLPSLYSGFENLMAIYGYGLQIYCDFSGYTDIAIGLALILGFRLPVNFNSPYKAADISDFWKRWHISLSRWLKDYLYIPLGGNRKGKIRTGINLMITMLLGGLWHGASLRFVIWGGLHGIGLVVNRIWSSIRGGRMKQSRFRRALAVFITFNFVSFCWIFFRAGDMNAVRLMLTQITENFSPGSYLTVLPAYATVFLLIITGYTIHFLPEKVKESYRGLFIKMPVVLQLMVIMLVAILLYSMRTTEVMPFIYFRF